ncbi:hypothetical protein L1049_000469 [Liquidambar formosana]|uniref:Uncharacterized protein n=1 Tax=Liquidambar formosana TaxID=63359 RepID=A0AAP0R5D8_LIQFO
MKAFGGWKLSPVGFSHFGCKLKRKYARSISVRSSTSVPPPSPHWPADASTPFHGPSSSYAPSLYGLYTSVPPRGLPAAFSLVHPPASSFALSPQVGPSTFMLDMFIEDYWTPPHTVRLSSLSAFTPGAPSHLPSFRPSIDAALADIAYHTPLHQPMMSEDIGIDEHPIRRGGRGRGRSRARARAGARGRGRALDHDVHPHRGVKQHVIHVHPEPDQQDVNGWPRRVRRRPPCGT